jgi:hypothetical protein
MSCSNTPAQEGDRNLAIQEIMERNPQAFVRMQQGIPNRGCTCARSGCIKKYCECYSNGILCTQFCKCTGCNNSC